MAELTELVHPARILHGFPFIEDRSAPPAGNASRTSTAYDPIMLGMSMTLRNLPRSRMPDKEMLFNQLKLLQRIFKGFRRDGSRALSLSAGVTLSVDELFPEEAVLKIQWPDKLTWIGIEDGVKPQPGDEHHFEQNLIEGVWVEPGDGVVRLHLSQLQMFSEGVHPAMRMDPLISIDVPSAGPATLKMALDAAREAYPYADAVQKCLRLAAAGIELSRMGEGLIEMSGVTSGQDGSRHAIKVTRLHLSEAEEIKITSAVGSRL